MLNGTRPKQTMNIEWKTTGTNERNVRQAKEKLEVPTGEGNQSFYSSTEGTCTLDTSASLMGTVSLEQRTNHVVRTTDTSTTVLPHVSSTLRLASWRLTTRHNSE